MLSHQQRQAAMLVTIPAGVITASAHEPSIVEYILPMLLFPLGLPVMMPLQFIERSTVTVEGT